MDEPQADASTDAGDPACWLDEVCPECGKIPDRKDDHDCAQVSPEDVS